MNHATPLLGGWMECTPLAKKLLTVFPQTPPSKVHPPPPPPLNQSPVLGRA